MRVLWLCNMIMPELATVFDLKKPNGGGWLTRAWSEIRNNNLQLGLCVPIKNPKYLKDGFFNDYNFYSFLLISSESEANIEYQKNRFIEILEDFKPDVVHIWGTENEHSFAMIDACKKIGINRKVVVSIQGLSSYIGELYTYGLNEAEITRNNQGNSIISEALDYKKKGEFEKKTIANVSNISGRTTWDRACINAMNPNAEYHFCRPMLRKAFYASRKWKFDKCKKHSVMISQAFYPIKGFHLIISCLSNLKKIYPDLQVNICGANPIEMDSQYGRILEALLRKYDVKDVVNFLGKKNEQEMIEEYLKTNVFLSASLIENESNSVCEAMFLGVPVVSSYVGGITSVVRHGEDGFLYPLNEPYMMKYYIQKIFDEDKTADMLSIKAIKAAEEYVDINKARSELLEMYNYIRNYRE